MENLLPRQIALGVLLKITGSLSAVFSATIVWMVLRSSRRRGRTFHRLIAALSLVDVLTSFWFFMSTWAIPRDSEIIRGVGTDQTCQLQAFFLQMSVCSVLYNVSLAFYYLLMIRYGWSNRSIARIEPLLHGLPLTWGLGTCFACYFLGAYEASYFFCWIGEDFGALRLATYTAPVLISLPIVLITSYYTWRHVRDLELRSSQYILQPGSSLNITPTETTGSQSTWNTHQNELKLSKKLGWQCLLYAGGCFITFFPRILNGFLLFFGIQSIPLIYITMTCTPMQGIPNILVYLLPEIKKLRKRNSGLWWGSGQNIVSNQNSNAAKCGESHDDETVMQTNKNRTERISLADAETGEREGKVVRSSSHAKKGDGRGTMVETHNNCSELHVDENEVDDLKDISNEAGDGVGYDQT